MYYCAFIPIYGNRQKLQTAYNQYVNNLIISENGIVDASKFIEADNEISISILCEYTNIIHARSNVYFADGQQLLAKWKEKKIEAVIPCRESFFTEGEYEYLSKKDGIAFKADNSCFVIQSEKNIMEDTIVAVSKPSSLKAKLESSLIFKEVRTLAIV